MPYTCAHNGSKWELTKKGSSQSFGTHSTKKECMRQMRAVYANEARNPKNLILEGYLSVPYNLENLIAESSNEINVTINSRGGSLFDAIIIHNRLRSSGKRIIVHIDPFAISAGAVVALAGDEIYMPENGLLMFHRPELSAESKNSDQLKELVNALDKSEEILIATICSKTKKSVEDCKAMINKVTWLTAKQAFEMGIVNMIIPIIRDSEVDNSFPVEILNHLKERTNMPLKDICAKFGIQASEADMEDKVSEFITNLQRQTPKQPIPVRPAIVAAVKKSREIELDNLVNSGKVVPAVVNELKLRFTTDEIIQKDLERDDYNANFETVVNALNKNEEVVSFKGKTGTQTIPNPGGTVKDLQNNEGENDDVLVKNMEKRVKDQQARMAAQQRQ